MRETGMSGGGVRFAGYAAVFDREDRGGDIVRRGAFGGGVGPGAGGKGGVPLLWQHLPDRPIGTIESLGEDARGLRVVGRVSEGRAAEALRDGKVGGLSFGYRVRTARGARPRELLDVELVEVSLVSFPMQPLARVHAVEG